MQDVVIIGSGGLAKEMAFLLEELNEVDFQWNVLGFVDNHKNNDLRLPIILNDNELLQRDKPLNVVFGIGFPEIRQKVYEKLKENSHLIFPNLIHPNVVGDWKNIILGEGNVICASSVLSTDIKIGNFNHINWDCTVGHDVTIGNFNVINPSVNVSGNAELGDTSLIGTGATILQQIRISSNVTIGAKALVNKNITQAGTYVGVPAKQIS
ncbi:MAG: acetyltransferase [Bacteroidia bacterium]|nr:acetyltransferase [Bacteroidia bacterium]NNJ56261.1 acetyltransferase [Bacteroidia bacterium]